MTDKCDMTNLESFDQNQGISISAGEMTAATEHSVTKIVSGILSSASFGRIILSNFVEPK